MSGASEHRRCPVTDAYSVIAPARKGATAHLRVGGGLPVLDGPCPFCPDAPHAPERTLLSVPPAEDGPWQVRVVPNKFPTVSLDATDGENGPGGYGLHELVIESADHDGDLATYDDAHVTRLFRVLRDRVAYMEARAGVAHVSVFRNRGQRGGASQPHPHSQVLGARTPGPEQVTRLETALRFHARTATNLGEDIARRELAAGVRTLSQRDGMLSLVPFAPRRTGEVWVLPERSRGSLSRFDDATLDAFACAVRDLASHVRRALDRSDYNVVLRAMPVAYADHPAAFTYAEIIPRGGTIAGFELATSAGLVTLLPETLAALLRETLQ